MTHRIDRPPVTPPEGGRLWITSAVLSVVAGIAAAVIRLGTLETLYLVAAMSLFGCLFVLPRDRGARAMPSVLRQGVELGLAAGAAVGLLTAFGVAGALLLVALVVTHHHVRQRLRAVVPWLDSPRQAGSRAGRSTPPGDPIPRRRAAGLQELHTTEKNLSQLSNEGLCLAWRRSFVVLGQAGSTPGVHALAEHRKLILDEIDRRDHQGLTRWLASNPRAAGNPLPFLTPSNDARPVDPPGTEQEHP